MSETRAWLEGKLRGVLPRPDLAPADIGRDVSAIAEAVRALEGRGGTAFGLLLGPDERKESEVLLPELRDGLASWRRFLAAELGDEGERFVDGILGRFGLRPSSALEQRGHPLGSRERLDEAQRRAVDRLAATLADGSLLTQRWAAEGQLIEESDQVSVSIGEPDHRQLVLMAQAFEARYGSPFPADLAHTLSVYNGVAVHSSERAEAPETIPANELSESTLWPANVYGDHLMLSAVDLSAAMTFFLIGGLTDSGFLALGIDGQGAQPGVYWVDREMSPPARIANGFSDFLSRWCDAALCLPLVLRDARVPGWGG